ncbi:hypothetical protein AB0F71_34825 [Kitasatospora sp. NPDC028055]|uniref:hypothetical protein n=1 Tax=Kitasatospora sp. NPDC028055 TaxID=3155653 RepID=UPI0033EBD1EA
MTPSIVVQYTGLLRNSSHDLWVRLRELLRGQGLDPEGTVVVDLLQESLSHEEGRVISADGRVYEFSLHYDQERAGGALDAHLSGWKDITDSWQGGALAPRTEFAFAWKSRSA